MSLKVAKHHCILHRYQNTEVAAILQPPTPKTFQRPATKTREIQNGGFLCPLLTYLLHGAESFLRSYLILQLIKKFPAFYGTRRFITVLTSARHPSLSWANSIQSPQPLPTSCRSLLTVMKSLISNNRVARCVRFDWHLGIDGRGVKLGVKEEARTEMNTIY